VRLLAINLPTVSSFSWEANFSVISQLWDFIFNKVKYKEHFTVLWKLQTDCNLEMLGFRN